MEADRIHRKNIALFNINGFYTPLVSFLEKIVADGLMDRMVLDSLIIAETVDDLIERLGREETVLPDKIWDSRN